MNVPRYQIDSGVQRHGNVVIGGSPLKLFRLAPAGVRVVDRIEGGESVDRSGLTAALLDAGAIHPAVGPGAGLTAGFTAGFTRDDVTIVVPALGRPPHPPDRALIVDDGSQPPIAAATIRLPQNLGPAAARNAGLAQVTTALVAFVDADVAVSDGWLDSLLPHFDDERVALVAPRVSSDPGTTAIARYEMGHSPLDLGTEPARVRAGSRVSYVPAAAIVCRVEALRQVGGFDDQLRLGEDVDLVWRLDDAGWSVRYEPASTVSHAPRPDWHAWAMQRIGYGSSAAPLARRHPRALAPLRMNGWSLATWLVGVTVHPAAGIAIGAGSAAALVEKLDDVPARIAFRLAWLGNLHAGDQISAAVRRVWWPIMMVAALRSRSARRILVAAALAARHPVRLADDVAYSIGVWHGMITERTPAPLIPRISSWPGRRPPSPPATDR